MDYATARRNMIEGQVRANRVTDRLVIDAMATIPRELFVPKHMRGIAYVDEDLDVGDGRVLIEPMVLARMIQEAAVDEADVALEIGCATGYASAVLSRLASTVVAVDSDRELLARTSAVMAELGIDNVAVMEAELTRGCPEQGPYDVIFVNGAVARLPQTILDQLADGGRLVAVIEESRPGIGTQVSQGVATLVTRRGDAFGHRALFDANVGRLPGFAEPPRFVF